MLAKVLCAVGILSLLLNAPAAANPVVVYGSDWDALDPTAVFLAGSLKDGEFGWLGVHIQNITPGLVEALDLDSEEGVLIDDVVDDSPAEEAGLMKGDVILRYDGSTVNDVKELTEMVRKTEPGTGIEIVINRKGRELTVLAEIGETEHGDFDAKSFALDLPFGILEGFNMPKESFKFEFQGSSKPRFGVGIQELDGQLAEFFEVSDEEGILVTEVYEDSPAEEAGVMAGDVIIKFDGKEIGETGELISAVQSADAGKTVMVEIVRKGRPMTLEAVLPDIEKEDKASRYYIQAMDEDKKELQKELDELKKELEKLKMELEKLQQER
jgi:C-terminal processing protease CtpA/Prc